MGAVEGVNDLQSRTEDHYDQQTVQETGNDVLETNTNTVTSNHRNKKKTDEGAVQRKKEKKLKQADREMYIFD